jgi:hypothetical protein
MAARGATEPIKDRFAVPEDVPSPELVEWIAAQAAADPSSVISPKVKASAAASAVATAVALVCAAFGVEFQLDEAGVSAVGAVLTLAVFAAGWAKRDDLRKP